MIATGLDKKDKKIQANILLHVIGPDAVKVYNGFTWAPAQGVNPAEDKEDPAQILQKFEDYCTPHKNITYERHLFNRRSQEVGETFDQFYTHLCHLSHTCEFGNMTDQMIRDRIVVGIQNPGLRERLLRIGEELTLIKAVDTCRTWEVTTSQIDSFKDPQLQVNSVQNNRGRGRNFQSHNRGRGSGQTSARLNSHQRQESKGNCQWCGYERHERNICPAREAKCNFCHQKGHFKSVCRKKGQQVHFLQDGSQNTPRQGVNSRASEDHDDFLGYITKDMGRISTMDRNHDICVKLNNIPLSFRVDTGADVTVIDKVTHDSYFTDKLLRKSSAKLRGPDLKELNIVVISMQR